MAKLNAVTQKPAGVSVDLAAELAKRLGVSVEYVVFDAAGKSVEALSTEKVDIGFFAVDPMRADAIVKGDAKVPAISAASILAKVSRDRWCLEYHQQFPQYGFDQHKGYGTADHLAALRLHGPCPQHRRTFRPVTDLLR